MMNRAYTILDIKAVKEDARIIEGIASTPSTDRVGDIIESMGAKFKLPMPLLWQHRSSEPVGWVEWAKPSKDGIPFKARIAKIEQPGELQNLTDKAWQCVASGLVQSLSIGFKVDTYEIIKATGGLLIKAWEWLELSLVTIPANADATITTVRSLDEALRAGKEQAGDDAGTARAVAKTKPVKLNQEKTAMAKTIAERLRENEATRAAKCAAMQAIMDAADEKGETLDADQDSKFVELKSEVDQLDKHIGRLQDMERINVSKAVAVRGEDGPAASESRGANNWNNGHSIITVRHRQVEPWVPFIRVVHAKLQAFYHGCSAYDIAKANEQWMAETPEVALALKAPVAAATTADATWAGPLVQYQNLSSAFAEFIHPLTIIGRIPGMRRVPFKIRVPRGVSGATVNWVGEGKAKPLTSLAFDTITMDFAKIAGIIPMTEEVIRFSNPAIEAIVRKELSDAIIQFMDSQFIDPSKAANDVSPASITNGATTITPSGTTAAALRSDVARLMAGFLQSNQGLASSVWIMTQTIAMRLSMMVNTLGQAEFPGITAQGGTFAGLPVVTSENIPSTTGSPTEGWPLILAKADEIMLADDGQVNVDASREASLQMETAPDSPVTASTVTVNLWQHNMVALKAERFINWRLRRSNAVAYIAGAVYTG